MLYVIITVIMCVCVYIYIHKQTAGMDREPQNKTKKCKRNRFSKFLCGGQVRCIMVHITDGDG